MEAQEHLNTNWHLLRDGSKQILVHDQAEYLSTPRIKTNIGKSVNKKFVNNLMQ